MAQLEELVLPLSVKNGISAVLAGVTAGVAAFTAAAGLAINATFKWAGELDSIQDVMGVTNKQAAALNFVLRKSGTETGKLTKGMTILEKGLVKTDGTLDTIGESLKNYGISALDVNGNVKDQANLISEISNKYSSFATQQERVSFLTDTFGKSGTELIDFFDTLAQEGGIDKVTDKVEKFGLAIDPARYEQFNRSLEELKLIGLGLAVSFTEKVMPIFERLLEIISDPNLTTPEKIGKIIKAADEFIGAWVEGLATSIDNWVKGNGPQKLADKFIKWIQGIGQDGEGTPDSAIIRAIEHLVTAIVKAIQSADWSSVGDALHEKFSSEMDRMFTDDDKAKLQIIVIALGALASAYILGQIGKLSIGLGLLGPILASMATGVKIVLSLLQTLGYLIAGLVLPSLIKLAVTTAPVLFGIGGVALAILGLLVAIGLVTYAIYLWIKHFHELFDVAYKTGYIIGVTFVQWLKDMGIWTDKLSDKIQNFTNKILEAQGALGGLMVAVFGAGGIGIINSLNQVTNVNTGGNTNRNRRASGGPVIAGQSYNVAEFFKPEVFTPNQSGRVDPMKETKISFDINYNKLASILATELAKVV